MALIDLLYHDINYERGLFYQLQSRGLVRRVVTDHAVSIAVTSAPTTTRAAMRGAFIREAKRWNRDFSVDWVHLKLTDDIQRTIILKDPFKSNDDRFQRLLSSLVRADASTVEG